jgi:hypothetical protein
VNNYFPPFFDGPTLPKPFKLRSTSQLVGRSLRFVKPRTRKILIIGIVLLILGPIIGWVIAMVVVTTQKTLAAPDIHQTFSEAGKFMTPWVVGTLSFMPGFLLSFYAVIKHKFDDQDKQEDDQETGRDL